MKPSLELKHSLCFDNNSTKGEDLASKLHLNPRVALAAVSSVFVHSLFIVAPIVLCFCRVLVFCAALSVVFNFASI